MVLSELTEDAVLRAIGEYEHLGRAAFLRKYGFGKARGYVLCHDGQFYDSKAIAGAAYGFLPGKAPLDHEEFSGGDQTVKTALDELGFKVAGPDEVFIPRVGTVLTNENIVLRFRVGTSGGMRRNSSANLLVLISDPFKGLYQDRWENGVLHYTGMGKVGHQTLKPRNTRMLASSRSSASPIRTSNWTLRRTCERFGCFQ